MNVQTEKIDNHIARITVEIETSQLEKAKKKAAKKLARYVNIPGFRKGKAPYRILVNYIGEGPIIEEAVEEIGNDIYPKALDESEVLPYTSGELEDFKLDPPTFVFTVPMQPTVELGDYKTVRVDFEQPEVEDKDVDEAMRRLQEEHALIEESNSPAKLGDRITADIHGFFTDDEEKNDEDEDENEEVHDNHDHDDEDGEEHDHDHDDFHSAPIHQHEAIIYLDEEREPVPGFAEKVVGITPDEEREFLLTYPEDEDTYGEFAGREVRFIVEIESVENVTLPELNDEFAARVTAEEAEDEEKEPLTLLQLRARLRENIEKSVEDQYKSEYADEVMDELVERATFAYPEAMIVNQIDGMIESSSQRFGLGVEDYMRLLQKTREDMHQDQDYRESAENYIKRSLIMRGILDEEEIKVPEGRISEEIDRVLSQFGEQAEMYRSLFDTPEMRENVTNNLLEQLIIDRIVGIGRGEEPPVVDPEEPDEENTSEAVDTEATEPEETDEA